MGLVYNLNSFQSLKLNVYYLVGTFNFTYSVASLNYLASPRVIEYEGYEYYNVVALSSGFKEGNQRRLPFIKRDFDV